jgi:hypothetical protein
MAGRKGDEGTENEVFEAVEGVDLIARYAVHVENMNPMKCVVISSAIWLHVPAMRILILKPPCLQ